MIQFNASKRRYVAALFIGCMAMVSSVTVAIAQPRTPRQNMLRKTDASFFKTAEARRIGDLVLLYQRVTGGWPKNIDMTHALGESELAHVTKNKARRDDSTIDNGATTMQLTYLARLYQGTHDERYREAFYRGIGYLLSGQYANGGWPQFWPEMEGYQLAITYNDDAMVNTLELFRDIFTETSPYDGHLTDVDLRQRLSNAFDKGIDCILKTQITVDGQLTVWCQQYDHETLTPTSARTFELVSFCSQESAAITRLLMRLPNPDARIKRAVHGAMKWFDTYKLTGLRYERRAWVNGERTSRLVEDQQGTPIWARYYDLERCEPFVCDRDGIPRRRLEQIGRERRNGYSWYGSRPAELFERYEVWSAQYDPENQIAISLKTKGANENGTTDMYRKPTIDRTLFDVIVKPGERIQAAIEQAPEKPSTPFKIFVLKGTYHQRINVDRPNIVLVGEHRDSTVIVLTDREATVTNPATGRPWGGTVIQLQREANDCVISGFTLFNDYGAAHTPTEQPYQMPHRMTVRGSATRTIIINCNIWSHGNDALALWTPESNGMYYHADLEIRTPGVDFICPRGWCYATRCNFYGDGRAMIWHDGRGDKNKKFVITNSSFDAKTPTLLGRYHHDAQFFLINNKMTNNILDGNIHYAYSDRVLDACVWGQRTYYYGNTREGGHSGWLTNNLPEDAPAFHGITAQWTFDGQWDPEQRIRQLWDVLAY